MTAGPRLAVVGESLTDLIPDGPGRFRALTGGGPAIPRSRRAAWECPVRSSRPSATARCRSTQSLGWSPKVSTWGQYCEFRGRPRSPS